MNWKVPNFDNEENIMNRFNDQDKENLRGLQRAMEKERADERKMDKFLEKQALNYY